MARPSVAPGIVTTADERSRRLEPDARRQQILRCAIQLFGDRPYAAVSTTELAEAAGVTRGLIHHYFGTKRGLYLDVVRSMVMVPDYDVAHGGSGTLEERVSQSVTWLLGAVLPYAKTFVAVTGAEGVGNDPEIEALLAEADDIAARRMLHILGLEHADAGDERQRAMVRAFGGLVKASIRELVQRETLTHAQVSALLTHTLLTIVRDVFPEIAAP